MAKMVLGVLLAAAVCGGCGPKQQGGESEDSPVGYTFPVVGDKYVVLDILTDNKDEADAKANAADALTRHPDIACMVGLWAYNPPQILNALSDAGKLGKVKVVGFDENPSTLNGISDGTVEGTIVQQPFGFGYKSVEFLAAYARGQDVEVPEGGMLYIDHSVITKDNVDEFKIQMQKIDDGVGDPPPKQRDDYDLSQPVKVAFITNSQDPFWEVARKGCQKGEADFQAECEFLAPPNGSVEEQKRYIEDLITRGYQGLAISPIDPSNQGEIINQACDKMPVICQDSDAPQTRRKFYLGTSNYLAGRAAGKLVKQAIPEGGKVMIFVGKLEVLNAQERSRGLIDELRDKPLPPQFAQAAESE
ncbi:MAG: substrate-binding domain-containing protein [Pirellulaceae bacterium]